MNILGIETTCDETSFSLVRGGREVIHEITMSQIDKHAPYGGVVPELGAREHVSNIQQLGEKFFKDISEYNVDAIAVASKVGLPPAVQVGEAYAAGLAKARKIPLIPVNHVIAHIWSVWIDEEFKEKPIFPLLGLVVSGGHTQLITFDSPTDYEVIGSTMDDALGESFDKVAQMLGLSYPGGPIIEKVAREGDSFVGEFPIPLENDKSLNFSLAGLKTAVRTYVEREMPKQHETYKEYFIADVAASFQKAAFTHIANKVGLALKETGYKQLVVGGGVAASQALTDRLYSYIQEAKLDCELFVPSRKNCTDNASMIAGYAVNLMQK